MAEKKSFINRSREKIGDWTEEAKDKIEDVEDSTIRYIKKNPLKSVLISLGVGAVIGAGITASAEAIRLRRKQSFWQKYNPFY